LYSFFFFQAEDGIRDRNVTGVQTCALPISARDRSPSSPGPSWKTPAPCSRLPRKTQMRGGARRLHARRTPCTLSVQPRAPTKQKIGRASCREREEIREGEGGVKRKKEEERE